MPCQVFNLLKGFEISSHRVTQSWHALQKVGFGAVVSYNRCYCALRECQN